MLYDEYAKEYTKSAGFGLAEQAYRQLSRLNG
jgi:Rod binding domain-containing protein